KDGSRMGNGMPEYVLKFRKPPTDRSNGYADVPVVKDKETYTRARWQFDAHGYHRSSGNRVLQPEELVGLPQEQVFKMFREYSLANVYDFEHNVRIANDVDATGWLPSTFMLLQPQSWHPEVWTDITRMLTLNGQQHAKGKELHLCPLQFDIVDRCIEQHSMPGEEVYDPFGGLGTVPFRALKLRRRGRSCELSHSYWLDSLAYCQAQARAMSMPDLFAALEQAA
ncbi:MAG TPA: DNA methyltransferase, partial [Solimonas sp.]